MKSIIKKLLREGLIGEARATINDLKDVLVLSDTGGLYILYDPINNVPLGYIATSLVSNGNVYVIWSAYAKSGYGPLLYELAMTYAYPNGITLDEGSPTSNEAINVWEKFYSRPDVKKEPINRSEMSYKEKELTNGCYGDTKCLEDIKRIIELHNLKYIYSLGKNNLQELVNRGHEFLKQNPNIDLEKLTQKLQAQYGGYDY